MIQQQTTKEEFHETIEDAISKIHKKDILIVNVIVMPYI